MSVLTFPHPVERIADLPIYCAKCGAAMLVEERTSGFDKRTGAPILTALARCSRRVWFGPNHDEYVVMPRPRPTPPNLLGSSTYIAPPENSDDE